MGTWLFDPKHIEFDNITSNGGIIFVPLDTKSLFQDGNERANQAMGYGDVLAARLEDKGVRVLNLTVNRALVTRGEFNEGKNPYARLEIQVSPDDVSSAMQTIKSFKGTPEEIIEDAHYKAARVARDVSQK